MNTENCPLLEKCPLFNNQLLKRQESAETYKKLYCLKAAKFSDCKRFIVSSQVGRCADYVLPNSFDSVESLIDRMRKDKIIS
jgi:hypothetical protein